MGCPFKTPPAPDCIASGYGWRFEHVSCEFRSMTWLWFETKMFQCSGTPVATSTSKSSSEIQRRVKHLQFDDKIILKINLVLIKPENRIFTFPLLCSAQLETNFKSTYLLLCIPSWHLQHQLSQVLCHYKISNL